MIGTHPTVGCLVLIGKPSFTSIENVVHTLQSIIPIRLLPRMGDAPLRGEAALGGGMHEIVIWVQEGDKTAAVHLEFDEDEVARVGRETGQSAEQLFMPYVQAAKTIPGTLAIGVGYELSSPRDLGQAALQEAGIAVLFARDEEHKSWLRQENLPIVGHAV